jgi:hypothetical protein
MKITKKYWQLYGWHLKPICVQGQNLVLIVVLKNTTVIAPHVAVFIFDKNEKILATSWLATLKLQKSLKCR